MADIQARLYLKTNNLLDTYIPITNSGFDGNLDGWTGSDWFYGQGRAYGRFNTTGSLTQAVSGIVIGRTYRISITVKFIYTIGVGNGIITFNLGGASTPIGTAGVHTFDIVATSTDGIEIDKSQYFKGYIDSIFITELTSLESIYEEIDLYDDSTTSLTFNRTDIEDITKRSSTFSKSISIPGTTNNRKVLDFLDDINVGETEKYFNKKIDCILYYGSFEILKGTFELESTSIIENSKHTQFEGIIYSNIKSFANSIGDYKLTGNNDYLNDIDFSEYDHPLSIDNVINTWNNNIGSGIYYPVINYTNLDSNHFRITTMRPALFQKEIWDKIFEKAGYTYTSEFLTDDVFKSLILPFCGDIVTSQMELDNRKFKVGMNSDYNNSAVFYHTNNERDSSRKLRIPLANDTGFDFNNSNNRYDTTAYNYVVPTTGIYKFTGGADVKVDFFHTGDVASGSYGMRGRGEVANVNIQLHISKYSDGVWSRVAIQEEKIPLPSEFFSLVGTTNELMFTTGMFTISINGYEEEFKEGDIVIMNAYISNRYIEYYNAIGGETLETFQCKAVPTLYFENPSDVTLPSTFFDVTSIAGDTIFEGETMFVNNVLPIGVKQIDYITSIINMFNLVVDEDKENENNLIIEPRGLYYSGGTIVDFSNKVDKESDMVIERIPTLVGKNITFNYKEDDDNYNVDYSDVNSGLIYGNNKILNIDETNSDFSVDVIFSPTPSDELGNTGIIIPQMYQTNDNDIVNLKSYNPRILFKTVESIPNNLNGSGVIVYYNNGADYISYYGKIYSACHFDSAYSPVNDLNFGICEDYFQELPYNLPPYGNLYNLYWREWVEQIISEDSKMITVMVRLTEMDIFNLKFSNQIKIDGQFYILTKIADWVPNELVEVQLLKLVTIILPTSSAEREIDVEERIGYDSIKYITPITPPNPNIVIGNDLQQSRPRSYITSFDLNTGTSFSATTGIGSISGLTSEFGGLNSPTYLTPNARGFVTGNNNNIASQDFMVVGKNNIINQSNTVSVFGTSNEIDDGVETLSIMGINNVVTGGTKNLTIIGNDNAITGSSENAVIIGNGFTGSTSGGTYITGDVFINGNEFKESLWTPGTGTNAVKIINFNAEASGEYSVASGLNTVASGDWSYAEGRGTEASNSWAHAEGINTKALKAASHAEGNASTADGTGAHAEGNSKALGNYSHSEGLGTIASGGYSHSEGNGTIASGDYSHSEGLDTVASGDYSHSEGNGTIASAQYSHGEGILCIASGTYSHAQNKSTQASGVASHAGGGAGSTTDKVIADGDFSFNHSYVSEDELGVYAHYSAILGGKNNLLEYTAENSVILGGHNITGTTINTVYVPNLNIDEVGGSIKMKSPDGTVWTITVDNSGNLTVV